MSVVIAMHEVDRCRSNVRKYDALRAILGCEGGEGFDVSEARLLDFGAYKSLGWLANK